MLGWSISAGLTACHAPQAVKYDGFIACSESDAPWAERLSQRLERYYAVRPLMPRQHFFRAPRKESSDYALTETTINALDASRSLIVICSPKAAQCHHVNEEIRLFKSHHPNRPVIPLIIDGKPGDEDGECFPPLLKFELDADGCITKGPLNVKATDAREWAGGHARAASRIASDLLGLSSHERTEQAPRRSLPIFNGRLGTLMNLCIVAGFAAIVVWNGLTTNQAFIERTLPLVSSGLSKAAQEAIDYGTPQSIVVGLLEHGEKLLFDVIERGPLSPEAEYRRATVLLGFARTYKELGEAKRALTRANDASDLLRMLRREVPKDADFQHRLGVAEEDLGKIRAGARSFSLH